MNTQATNESGNGNTTGKTPTIDTVLETTHGMEGLILNFSNGKRLTLRIADLTNELHIQAILHGLKQKLVDAAAISRNPDNGKSATVDDKYNAVKEVFDRLLTGQWNKNRDAGTVRGGLLFRALCMLYPDKSGDAIKTFLEKKSAAEKTALRATPKIAAIIEDLKADDVKNQKDTGVDTDALLGELDD